MGQLAVDGYRFDTGPTVLTMPDLLEETLAAAGERMSDWLDLIRLDPAYRAHFADGSTLDIRADTAGTAAEIARLCGPREADGYLRFVDYARTLYQLEWKRFIDRDFDHPWELVSADLARLAAYGGFRRLSAKVRSSCAIRAPSGCSRSSRCTPACRRIARWPCTRSSPTWTRWRASTSRAAACTRSPPR